MRVLCWLRLPKALLSLSGAQWLRLHACVLGGRGDLASWLLYCCFQEDGVTSPRSGEGCGRALAGPEQTASAVPRDLPAWKGLVAASA